MQIICYFCHKTVPDYMYYPIPYKNIDRHGCYHCKCSYDKKRKYQPDTGTWLGKRKPVQKNTTHSIFKVQAKIPRKKLSLKVLSDYFLVE